MERIHSAPVLPSQSPCAGSSNCGLTHVGRRCWRRAWCPPRKQTSLAVDLTLSTVCSRLPEVWLYSCTEEHCSESVLLCPVRSIPPGEGARAGRWLLYHRGRPQILSYGEPRCRLGARMPSHPKTSHMELSLSQHQNAAAPGSKQQCLRRGGQGAGGDVAATTGGHGRERFCSQMLCWFKVSLSFFPLGQHDPVQGFLKVVITRHS